MLISDPVLIMLLHVLVRMFIFRLKEIKGRHDITQVL